jgi:peptide/nickel transport system permease protein
MVQAPVEEVLATPTELREALPPAANRAWRAFWSHPLSIAGVAMLAFLVAFSFLGPLVYPANPYNPNLLAVLHAPNASYPLGTDGLGRDYLARMMYGGQPSLEVGFAAAAASMFIGTLYGTVSGLVGGWVDMVLMRIVDVLLSIPSIFLLLFLDATFKPSALLLVLILAALGWFGVSRLVRAEVLSLKSRDFIEAQRAAGASTWRIMVRGLFPNFLGTVLVAGTFQVADSILTLAGLSFLGLGLPPPAPNWGGLLSDSMNYMFQNAWWLIYPPGLAILMAQLAVNFIGDGLRGAFNLQLR